MRPILNQILLQNFPHQTHTALQLLENPLQTRSHYNTPDFDKHFAFLSNFGIATIIKVPTSRGLLDVYYLSQAELLALISRSMAAPFLPEIFLQLSAKGSGIPSEFLNNSRSGTQQAINNDFAILSQLQILQQNKLFILQKQGITSFIEANSISYDPRTDSFLKHQSNKKSVLCAASTAAKFFKNEEFLTESYFVNYQNVQKFAQLKLAIQQLSVNFDEQFARILQFGAETTQAHLNLGKKFAIKDIIDMCQYQQQTISGILQTAFQQNLVVLSGESYEINVEEMIQQLQFASCAKMLSNRNGSAGGRIFRLLLNRGCLDENQIAQEAMISTKTASQTVQELFKQGFLSCSNLQRGELNENSIVLYSVESQQMRKNCLGAFSSVLARIMVNMREERDSSKLQKLQYAFMRVLQGYVVFL
ncbi:hypothetical protein SS50377_24129 [Spironucleus salmonicida]|uniref:DNA-directed RNA polymerase III subunit RPC3 n=1 Tax=Spironucleus salmonicida TaxID=348837 RepID=V6LIF0_9EUKA|nr:hypothetical protein SS50377_24129 [Spironucleus salmonicida]|eukprot:EST44093.1 hypothetical protein SS50377_16092 [Spironucleus salmonicida]